MDPSPSRLGRNLAFASLCTIGLAALCFVGGQLGLIGGQLGIPIIFVLILVALCLAGAGGFMMFVQKDESNGWWAATATLALGSIVLFWVILCILFLFLLFLLLFGALLMSRGTALLE